MLNVEKNILNANSLRTTKYIANKLFIENFCHFDVDKRVFLANVLDINILSASFYKKVIDNKISRDVYLESIIFSLKNLEVFSNMFRVTYKGEKYSCSKIKLDNFIVIWMNINNRFENNSEINNLFIHLFKNILKNGNINDSFTCIKEYIRHKNDFDLLSQKDKDEIEYLIYNIYLNDDVGTNEYQDIALSSELIMSSEKFKVNVQKFKNYEYKYKLVNLEALIKHPELKNVVTIYIQNKESMDKFEVLKKEGFKYKLYTNVMDRFNTLNITTYGQDSVVSGILNILPDETKMFLVENMNLKLINSDFLKDLRLYLDDFGNISSENKDVFILKHAI